MGTAAIISIGIAYVLVLVVVTMAIGVLLWELAIKKSRRWFVGLFIVGYLLTITQYASVQYMAYIVIAAWSAVLSAVAFWRAANNNHLGWFVALLLIPSVMAAIPVLEWAADFAVLQVIYLIFVDKIKLEEVKNPGRWLS
ncbi:hypothetical protein HGB24_03120 [Candidatus Saccharibacteria bacterium]|nr:hypothetical protein [Candidatus Saccharibacteria bacterium]